MKFSQLGQLGFGTTQAIACQVVFVALVSATLPVEAFALDGPTPLDIRASLSATQVDAAPARATLVAPGKAAPAVMQALPQVNDRLPPSTLVAPPKSAPLRAESAQQLHLQLPRPTLLAPVPSAAEKLPRNPQPGIPGRLALQAYRPPLMGQPVTGTVSPEGLSPSACAPTPHTAQTDSGECLLGSEGSETAQQGPALTLMAQEPLTGEEPPPGLMRTAQRNTRWLEAVSHYLAGLSAQSGTSNTGAKLPDTSAAPGSSMAPGQKAANGSSFSIEVPEGTVVNVDTGVSGNNVVTVDLMQASGSSYVNGLTLNGDSTVALIAAPGSTLQLNNISLASGTGSQTSTLVLQTAAGGTLQLFGGSSTGSGGSTAQVRSVSIVQTGGAQVVTIGLNGTSGTTLNLVQSTTAASTLSMDLLSKDLTLAIAQSGSAGQVASGIVLRAAPGSVFMLSQK